jgi:hypothetical protein
MSIDIDAPGKYPIVLSDALLGKPSQESFTSIRCTSIHILSSRSQPSNDIIDNHKPDATSSSALSSQRLQPSKSDPSSYDLSFSDESGRYKYNGVQTSEDGEYVLIFNPEKKHFVLHRLDSTFDMNLVSAPWENNASALQSQYTQLESASKPDAEVPQRKASKATKSVPAAKQEPKRRKSTQAKKKPPVREPTPEEEEEEEEEGDSDDGLTIEYPDARNAPQYKPQPSTAVQQLVSDEEEEEEDDDDEDADGEADEQQNRDVDYLTLPSPANNHAGLVSDEDMELDLVAELEQALQETTEGAGNDESDESEEE